MVDNEATNKTIEQQLQSTARRTGSWMLIACSCSNRGRHNKTEGRTRNSLTRASSLEDKIEMLKMMEECEDMHEVAWH